MAHKKRNGRPACAVLLFCVLLLGGCTTLPAGGRPAGTLQSATFAIAPVIGQKQPPQGTWPAPASRILPVENILQNPQLPNGCEATSLAILLGYHGFTVDKMEMAYQYLPREAFRYEDGVFTGADPDKAYAGDPATNYGFYCFASPATTGANRYLVGQNTALRAWNITGADEDELISLLARGLPMVVWKTTDHAAPRRSSTISWHLAASGEQYVPYMNLHVVVLCGYDEEYFYFCDPHGRRPQIERAEFMADFERMGSRAVVIE